MSLFLKDNNLLRLASFPNSQPSYVKYKEFNIQNSPPFICSYSQSCWWLDVEYVDIERRWALELLSENNLETLWVTPSHSRAYQRLRRYFTKIDWQGHANWWRKKIMPCKLVEKKTRPCKLVEEEKQCHACTFVPTTPYSLHYIDTCMFFCSEYCML